MAVFELEYTGDDLIISKEVAEKELGLHPGDRLEIRPKQLLVPVNRSLEERQRIEQDLEALQQAFATQDLDDWETSRQELWATWKNPI